MRGDDAKKKCPSIKLVQVPEVRGKADLTKYVYIRITIKTWFVKFFNDFECYHLGTEMQVRK